MINLRPNQRGRVLRIDTSDHGKLRKIMAMGVFPGSTIVLIQRFPSYVFQIGQSQFAMDKELAKNIVVCAHAADFPGK